MSQHQQTPEYITRVPKPRTNRSTVNTAAPEPFSGLTAPSLVFPSLLPHPRLTALWLRPPLEADLLQRGGVGGGGAGQQCGDAAGLPDQHPAGHRGVRGPVPPGHEGGVQAAAQAGGGAVRPAGERGGRGPRGGVREGEGEERTLHKGTVLKHVL